MLLDQIIGLNFIQIAAIPMILLVVLESGFYNYSKKKDNSLDNQVYVGSIRFIKNRDFLLYCFFTIYPLSIQRMVDPCPLLLCIRFF
jgi:hypothetical protein